MTDHPSSSHFFPPEYGNFAVLIASTGKHTDSPTRKLWMGILGIGEFHLLFLFQR